MDYRDRPVKAKQYHFAGNRQQIRERSVMAGLDLLRHALNEDTDLKK